MILIEMQYSSTALLLLVNPCILHWNNGTACPSYILFDLIWRTKMNGTQRRALVSPWRMHCMYSGVAKGTSRAELATLNSEKIKPVALAIVELREFEGIRQAVS